MRDCFRWGIDEGPTFYQEEIMVALLERGRATVRGPHGLGKTGLSSWIILWFALTRDAMGVDWKVPTTASAWRQLERFLWPEVSKWARRLKWDLIGRDPFDSRTELLSFSLRLTYGQAFAAASDNSELLEGAHADSLLYLFDESKAIPDSTFDAAEGAFAGAGKDTKSEAFALAVSTPGEPQGRFYDIHSRKPGFADWWVRHVTVEECIAAGRMSNDWVEQRKIQWGETSSVYQNRCLGEFAASDEEGIIPLSWVEMSMDRWRDWNDMGAVKEDFTCVGVDVARSGYDKTVMAMRYSRIIAELRRTSKEDTMQTVGRVAGILRVNKGLAVVDLDGIGAGVVDRLREQNLEVVAFNATERTDRRDRSGELGFVNKRAAAWWNMRELLDPLNEEPIALPPDEKLLGDLVAPHTKSHSSGKIMVEAKNEIRDRLGRSTDDGDAVVMAFFTEQRTLLPFSWIKLPEEVTV